VGPAFVEVLVGDGFLVDARWPRCPSAWILGARRSVSHVTATACPRSPQQCRAATEWWRSPSLAGGQQSPEVGHGSSHDPDPLLVITPDGAIEYASERQPLTVVNFYDLAEIALRVRGSSFSDSTIVTLDVWIDLHGRDGRKTKWRSTSFADDLQSIQCFIEAYGAHRALQGR